MWKSLPTVHPEETVQVYSQSMTWLQEHHKILIFTSACGIPTVKSHTKTNFYRLPYPIHEKFGLGMRL